MFQVQFLGSLVSGTPHSCSRKGLSRVPGGLLSLRRNKPGLNDFLAWLRIKPLCVFAEAAAEFIYSRYLESAFCRQRNRKSVCISKSINTKAPVNFSEVKAQWRSNLHSTWQSVTNNKQQQQHYYWEKQFAAALGPHRTGGPQPWRPQKNTEWRLNIVEGWLLGSKYSLVQWHLLPRKNAYSKATRAISRNFIWQT